MMAVSTFAASVAHAQAGEPLSEQARRGAMIALDSERGNCTICHVIPGLPVPVDAQGNLGPALEGVATYLSAEELRDRITDPRRLMGETIMPAYGSTDGLTDVAPEFAGRPILTEGEITDLVAFLETLR